MAICLPHIGSTSESPSIDKVIGRIVTRAAEGYKVTNSLFQRTLEFLSHNNVIMLSTYNKYNCDTFIFEVLVA